MVRRRGALFLLALAALGAAASTVEAASAKEQNLAAWQAFQRRDFRAAEDLAGEAWARAEEDRDTLQAAFAGANLAAAAAMRGRLDEGAEWSRRAEERLGAGREPKIRGRILAARAILRKARGEDEGSRQAFIKAREALGANDWSLSFAETLVKAYDWEDLQSAYESMKALHDVAKEPRQRAMTLLVLGWIEGVGGLTDAVKRFEEARAILAPEGLKAALPFIDHNLGSVLLWADRLDEAQPAFERGLLEARAAGDRGAEVVLLDDLSQLFSQREDWSRAVTMDRDAGARLASVMEDVRGGRVDDSLLLDLRRLVKARFVHKPQLHIDLFLGLFDQLAVDPTLPGAGKQ